MTTQPNSSVRRILGVAVTLMVVMPGIALAQPPRQPTVELGAQVSTRSDVAPVSWALRLAIPNANPQSATPPPASWRRVKPGRKVWVTTNTGSLVHGEVAAISDSSLNIREQDREVTIRLDEVRLVEGRDSLTNGVLIGAVPGAVAGGVLLGEVSSAICESDSCDSIGAVLFGVASGAAIGGLLGMMVDGLIPGRQTLFGGNTIVVKPVITPTGKAVNVAIRWR